MACLGVNIDDKMVAPRTIFDKGSNMTRPGKAGYSARMKAREIKQEQRQVAVTWGVFSGGSTAVLSYMASWAPVGSLAAGAVVGVGLSVWRSRKPSGADRWIQGAKAEERTAVLLKPLANLGWLVCHDRTIPRSRANLDHVAVHPSGRFLVYIDTKAWHAKSAPIRYDGNRLMYGPWDKTSNMRTVEWMADRLRDEVGLPVVPVIAVDGGVVVGQPGRAGFLEIDGTYVISSKILFTTMALMNQSSGPDANKVKRISAILEQKFPAAQ